MSDSILIDGVCFFFSLSLSIRDRETKFTLRYDTIQTSQKKISLLASVFIYNNVCVSVTVSLCVAIEMTSTINRILYTQNHLTHALCVCVYIMKTTSHRANTHTHGESKTETYINAKYVQTKW